MAFICGHYCEKIWISIKMRLKIAFLKSNPYHHGASELILIMTPTQTFITTVTIMLLKFQLRTIVLTSTVFSHIGIRTKWLPFCRWHFQKHFLVGKYVYLVSIWIEFCSSGSNCPALVVVMAWCCQTTGHYMNPCWSTYLLLNLLWTLVKKWNYIKKIKSFKCDIIGLIF